MLRWSALADVMEVRPLSLSRLQVLFTFFPKCFSNFRSRYLFDIGLPTLYLTLADTYLPIDASLPRSATRLVLPNEMLGFLAQWAVTFFGSILT
jgi:hypothetical protein